MSDSMWPHRWQPPGSPVPGILQARTLEWVAISFSNAWKWKVKAKSLSRVRLLATPRIAAHQAPPSMGFSKQKHWSECHCLLRIYRLVAAKFMKIYILLVLLDQCKHRMHLTKILPYFIMTYGRVKILVGSWYYNEEEYFLYWYRPHCARGS